MRIQRVPASRKRRWLRRLTCTTVGTGLLTLVAFALPAAVYAAPNLEVYGATGTGWGVQPYIENDSFTNIPATDEQSPFTFVNIDNSPSADAKAIFFTPGTAAPGLLATNNVNYKAPDGVEAQYPDTPSASNQVAALNDKTASQASAGSESAQVSEANATASAALTHYEFIPPLAITQSPPPPPPNTGPLPVPVPSVTAPALPTPPSIGGGGGTSPTATPSSGGGSQPPAPTPTTCPQLIGPICLAESLDAAPTGPAHPQAAVPLPDALEKQLIAVCQQLTAANGMLASLANASACVPNSTLAYAAADTSSHSEVHAADSGVTVAVTSHLGNVELLQGLFTARSIDATLSGLAPATEVQGSGKITTTVGDAKLFGIPITFDQNGVTIGSQQNPQAPAALPNPCAATTQGARTDQALTAALNCALQKAGVSIALNQNTTSSDIEKWSGHGGGIEITAVFDPTTGLPPAPALPTIAVPGGPAIPAVPATGVPTTHVDFTLGEVSGSVYALPGTQTDTSGVGSDGGGFSPGSFFSACGSFFGGSTPTTQPAATKRTGSGSGLFSLPGSASPGELLAMLFTVQGFSTAAVAAAALGAEEAAKAGKLLIEEETR